MNRKSYMMLSALAIAFASAPNLRAATPTNQAPAEGAMVKTAANPEVIRETPALRDARMAWWHEAKFGMFIHWGLYAIPAKGEWVMNQKKIPVAEYAKLAGEFNPVKFNAEEWVRFAKEAGMKYIVITAKHHDGFAMYHSKVSPYNIVDATPFKRDPIKELAAACAKEGIKHGLYYSQAQDWYEPGGSMGGARWDPAQKGDFDHYLKTLSIPQLKEIITDYKPAVIWFDTPHQMTPEISREMVQAIRSINPNTILNSRLLYHGYQIEGLEQAKLDGLRDIGVDYLSYRDRQIPDHPAASWNDSWETCMTLNGAWGYTATDHNWKSQQTVVQMVTRVASKGGNLLLNFGPTAEGEIPGESVEIMKQVGAWLKVNGESVYGTSRSPFSNLSWGVATRKDGTLYLHVFDWPKDGELIVPLSNQAKSATLLATGKPLSTKSADGNLVIDVPATAPDAADTVIALQIEGEPVTPPSPTVAQPNSPAAAPLPGYKLVWSDEFNDGKLDTSKWGFRTDSKMWSTQKPQNVSVRDGKIFLAVKKEEAGDKHYTGAGVISKQAFKYGYYESRFKVPPGAGWHTSFWLMKHDGKGGTGTGVTAQELDVCESDSVNLTHYGVNVHKWNPKPHVGMGYKKVTTPDLSADFHTFGCEFTPETVKYYFEGKLVQTVAVTNFAHSDQHIWLTTIASHLGKTKAVEDTKLPAAAEYDYVRFHQKQ
jgi:alpha-L-fucosidase